MQRDAEREKSAKRAESCLDDASQPGVPALAEDDDETTNRFPRGDGSEEGAYCPRPFCIPGEQFGPRNLGTVRRTSVAASNERWPHVRPHLPESPM